MVQVGRLELPGSLLSSGDRAPPYYAPWSLSAEATGAGTLKSRTNLLRMSLMT